MKVTPLAGAATNRTTMLQMVTKTAASALSGVTPFVARAIAAAPPPRASSFGGADPRAMFEALVQSFDSDGDGKLSLDEVNALNQSGLLSRSFARIDSNSDGKISGDEVAARAPWRPDTSSSGGRAGERGASIRPLFDKPTTNLEGAISASDPSVARNTNGVGKVLPHSPTQMPSVVPAIQTEPATLMESMVLALSTTAPTELDTARAEGIKQIYAAR